MHMCSDRLLASYNCFAITTAVQRESDVISALHSNNSL